MQFTVTQFLDTLHHPYRAEIDALRRVILAADSRLHESVKWNAPSYAIGEMDCFTMRILPPKRQVQLIFHRGAKPQSPPAERLIADPLGLLAWKGNDRAVMTFSDMAAIESSATAIGSLIRAWIAAAQ